MAYKPQSAVVISVNKKAKALKHEVKMTQQIERKREIQVSRGTTRALSRMQGKVKGVKETITTAMRAAFENIKVAKTAYTEKGAIIGSQISQSLTTKQGVHAVPDWNAHLSFKTAQHLDAPNFNPMSKPTADKPARSLFNERAWSTGTYNKMCA